jgi:cephalosporin-C deacetylase-like acetyl esterase
VSRLLSLILFAAALIAAGASPTIAQKEPGTGPWDLKAFFKTPTVEMGAAEELREGDVKIKLSTLYYEGEPWMGKPTRVFAYYARPAEPEDKKKVPAMVLVHGGGGTAFPEWARLWASRGYAALAMDLSGCEANRKQMTDGGPPQSDEWKFKRLKDGVKNMWPYHAVAAVLRAHSLLRSFPEVDRNRIGITGISWGGYLTCLAMSLDNRFKAAVPVYGCGFLHENSVWLPVFASLPEDEKKTWVENFDPSRYLARCKTPSLWVNGTNDFAYPLDSYQKSYRSVRGPRLLSVQVRLPHGHPQGWAPQEIHLFTDSIFRRNDFARGLPLVRPPVIDVDKVKMLYDGDTAVESSAFNWTTDLDKPWQQREWKTSTASVLGLNDIEAELPKERPLIFFLTVKDNRGAIVSTEHVELRK